MSYAWILLIYKNRGREIFTLEKGVTSIGSSSSNTIQCLNPNVQIYSHAQFFVMTSGKVSIASMYGKVFIENTWYKHRFDLIELKHGTQVSIGVFPSVHGTVYQLVQLRSSVYSILPKRKAISDEIETAINNQTKKQEQHQFEKGVTKGAVVVIAKKSNLPIVFVEHKKNSDRNFKQDDQSIHGNGSFQYENDLVLPRAAAIDHKIKSERVDEFVLPGTPFARKHFPNRMHNDIVGKENEHQFGKAIGKSVPLLAKKGIQAGLFRDKKNIIDRSVIAQSPSFVDEEDDEESNADITGIETQVWTGGRHLLYDSDSDDELDQQKERMNENGNEYRDDCELSLQRGTPVDHKIKTERVDELVLPGTAVVKKNFPLRMHTEIVRQENQHEFEESIRKGATGKEAIAATLSRNKKNIIDHSVIAQSSSFVDNEEDDEEINAAITGIETQVWTGGRHLLYDSDSDDELDQQKERMNENGNEYRDDCELSLQRGTPIDHKIKTERVDELVLPGTAVVKKNFPLRMHTEIVRQENQHEFEESIRKGATGKEAIAATLSRNKKNIIDHSVIAQSSSFVDNEEDDEEINAAITGIETQVWTGGRHLLYDSDSDDELDQQKERMNENGNEYRDDYELSLQRGTAIDHNIKTERVDELVLPGTAVGKKNFPLRMHTEIVRQENQLEFEESIRKGAPGKEAIAATLFRDKKQIIDRVSDDALEEENETMNGNGDDFEEDSESLHFAKLTSRKRKLGRNAQEASTSKQPKFKSSDIAANEYLDASDLIDLIDQKTVPAAPTNDENHFYEGPNNDDELYDLETAPNKKPKKSRQIKRSLMHGSVPHPDIQCPYTNIKCNGWSFDEDEVISMTRVNRHLSCDLHKTMYMKQKKPTAPQILLLLNQPTWYGQCCFCPAQIDGLFTQHIANHFTLNLSEKDAKWNHLALYKFLQQNNDPLYCKGTLVPIQLLINTRLGIVGHGKTNVYKLLIAKIKEKLPQLFDRFEFTDTNEFDEFEEYVKVIIYIADKTREVFVDTCDGNIAERTMEMFQDKIGGYKILKTKEFSIGMLGYAKSKEQQHSFALVKLIKKHSVDFLASMEHNIVSNLI